jgi:hypothetical protein
LVTQASERTHQYFGGSASGMEQGTEVAWRMRFDRSGSCLSGRTLVAKSFGEGA